MNQRRREAREKEGRLTARSSSVGEGRGRLVSAVEDMAESQLA